LILGRIQGSAFGANKQGLEITWQLSEPFIGDAFQKTGRQQAV